MEPLHSKCLFRRASAHHHLNHFEEARLYLGQLLAAEPGNAAAKKELQEVAKSEKEYAARQRQRYGGMFGKQGSNLYEDKEEERRHREKQAREREVRGALPEAACVAPYVTRPTSPRSCFATSTRKTK